MYKANIENVGKLIKGHITKKIPLKVTGGFGIGKSEKFKQVAENISDDNKLIFKEWNEMTELEKVNCEKNPEKYYVLFDERLSEYDVTDIKGLFDLNNKDYCDFIPQRWVVYVTKPKANGVIFFDEINLADEQVQKSAYKVIHDRNVNDKKISKQVAIVCAGNRAEDKCNVVDMPEALRDRMSEVEMEIDPDLTINYVEQQDWCNLKLLAYFRYRPDRIYRPAETKEDKSTTPRGLERAMKLIGNISNPIDYELELSSAIGEVVTRESISFLKLSEKIDLRDILKNPKKVKAIDEISTKYSMIIALVELFRKEGKLITSMVKVANELEPEFAILLLRQMKLANTEPFNKFLMGDSVDSKKAHKLMTELFD